MKYSSGPQVSTMPKDGPDSIEVRSRAGDARQFSPSAARNCGPIREVLTRVLPKKGIALEIGFGTGEHVICFAKALPGSSGCRAKGSPRLRGIQLIRTDRICPLGTFLKPGDEQTMSGH